jgi:hypothetical protein
MKPNIEELRKIIVASFASSIKQKENMSTNFDRSTRFVSILSKKIHSTWYSNNKLNLKSIDEHGKKFGGEWLYDMCITETRKIFDKRYKNSSAEINVKVLFAMECEFSTGLKDFADDFGKLLCSGADDYLFVQGLNQITESERKKFIENRKDIIKTELSMNAKNFFIAFVPTPGKRNDPVSLWNRDEVLTNWIEVYLYDKANSTYY